MATQHPFIYQPSTEQQFDFIFGHEEPWSNTDDSLHFDGMDITPTATSYIQNYSQEAFLSSLCDNAPQYIPLDSEYSMDHTSSASLEEQWETNTAQSSIPSTPRSTAAHMVDIRYDASDLFSEDFYPMSIEVGPCHEYASLARLSRSSSVYSSIDAESSSSLSRAGSTRRTRASSEDMAQWGVKHSDGTWTCGFDGCVSRTKFRRSCDLRKHYKRHERSFFCRHAGCPQATEGGFATKKDRLRHEARHNPSIECEWKGCSRVFSRLDNMRDHVRRVHSRPQ